MMEDKEGTGDRSRTYTPRELGEIAAGIRRLLAAIETGEISPVVAPSIG